MKPTGKRYWFFGVMGVLFVTTLGAFFGLDDNFRFNHKRHVKTLGIDCVICHESSASGALMSFPDHDTCASCHEITEPDSCKFCHLSEEKFEAFRKEAAFPGVIFQHERHKGRDCLACHEGVEQSRLAQDAFLPSMDLCLDCHQDRRGSKPEDCRFCHETGMDKPADHSPLWAKNHGRDLRSQDQTHKCRYCHNGEAAPSCRECHQREAPSSHTLSFKIKGHGQGSKLNRQNCLICHEQASCLDCHHKTAPISHTAMYGSPYHRHCNNCHIASGGANLSTTGSNCYFCHAESKTQSLHIAKAALPVGHMRSNCLTCHRSGGGNNIPAMKHPGSGNDAFCLQCHN